MSDQPEPARRADRGATLLEREEVPWDDLSERRALGALRERVSEGEEEARSSPVRSWGKWAMVALVLCALGVALWTTRVVDQEEPNEDTVAKVTPKAPPAEPERAQSSEVVAAAVLALPEGSRVLAGGSASLEMVEQTERSVRIDQRAGHARYEVAKAPSREAFVVQVEQVTITVVGTTFEVEVFEDKVSVSVEHGEVKVAATGRVISLKSGEQLSLPRAPSSPTSPSPNPRPKSKTTPTKAATPPSLEQVLAQVDALRASGDKPQAISVLKDALTRAPRSKQYASAWFLLGRLEPPGARATRAYHTAYKLDPKGPLAEDALAAEVRSLHAEGRLQRAKARRELYLQRFPQGLHVQSLSGITLEP